MSEPKPAGPFDVLPLPGGGSAPLYLIPYDEKGRCEGPGTLEHLISEARSGGYNHIYVFSHGWNNVFKDAVTLYRDFFTGYLDLWRQSDRSTANYKPLLVGILWPSTALVSEVEATPNFASVPPVDVRAEALIADQLAIRDLASEIRDEDVERFHQLASFARSLTHEEALELARILLPILGRPDSTGEEIPQKVTAEKLVSAWEKSEVPVKSISSRDAGQIGRPGTLPLDHVVSDTAQPASAGILDILDPKNIIRMATVYQMKDRAGTVGAKGVGALLRDLLASSKAKVHLIGHSYGAKVVLSALCSPTHSRNVASLLLLQPAVNFLCFSANVEGHPGGYRSALSRVDMPIFSTFSSQDAPLTKFFHLALRRDGDLGEQRIAAAPSQFSALGGFGPAGMNAGESTTIEILAPPEKYKFENTRIRIYGLNGSNGEITGHGDISNKFTEWALLNLVSDKE